MKVSSLSILAALLSLASGPALSDTCSRTVTISPGHWAGCPDACHWVPPRTETIEYPC